jgi:TRAP-type C4-dicarboxylate transport system permease small subunit
MFQEELMMKYYHKFAELCFNVLRYLAMLTVGAMLVLMVTEVVRRYIFSVTWAWSDEIIRYLLVFCTYFGGTAAYYRHGMVSFDMLTKVFPKRVQNVLLLINNVILMVFFAFLIYLTYFKMTSPSVVKSISTSSGLSAAVPYSAIFFGLIFLLIFTIDFYPELIRNVLLKQGNEKEVV